MKQSSLIPFERIEKAIYLIRGEKIMLDRDLAALYGVATKVLKQAVRRNPDRFPTDFHVRPRPQRVPALEVKICDPRKRIVKDCAIRPRPSPNTEF